MTRNIKLIIEYDGTNYHGWQIQNNAVTIQEIIEKAIQRVTNMECTLVSSGRTDTGVHAYGMVANFKTAANIPDDKFMYAINSELPDDIVIKDSKAVGMDFHSRYSAVGKKYMYKVYNSNVPSALERNRVYYIKYKLDIDLMNKGKDFLLGTHNFEAFSAKGSSVKSFERTIKEIIIDEEGPYINFYYKANGFLYNMVRILTGTLIKVGLGKIDVNDIKDIIKSQDRNLAGPTVPPCGLYLMEVYY